MLDQFTFLLAVAGYAGLAAMVAIGRQPGAAVLRRVTAAAIVTHVALVWGARYGGSLAAATRNGYAGFLIFHAALVLIITSLFVRDTRANLFSRVAFAIVTVGAIGAVFRYDVVAMHRIPVILIAIFGVGAGVRTYRSTPASKAS